MPRVVYAPEAENDLVEIADHIARDKPQAARRWVDTIRETWIRWRRNRRLVNCDGVLGSQVVALLLSATTLFSIGQPSTKLRWLESSTEVVT